MPFIPNPLPALSAAQNGRRAHERRMKRAREEERSRAQQKEKNQTKRKTPSRFG